MFKNNPLLLGLKNQFKQENKQEALLKQQDSKEIKKQPQLKNTQKLTSAKDFANKLKTIEGKVKSSAKSYGFLETDTQDYFITPKDMHKVFAGDIIKAKIKLRQSDASLQAEPIAIISPGFVKILGKINLSDDGAKIELEKNNSIVLFDLEQVPADIEDKSWIEAELSEHLLTNKQDFKFKFLRLITYEKDPWLTWKLALARYNFAVKPPEVKADFLAKLADENWLDRAAAKREDLTSLEFFTLDGSFTKDMDDAIFIQRVFPDEFAKIPSKSHWRLHIAIADPDLYIESGSQLDQAAKESISSIYLAGNKDTPMLPKEITENFSSLVPNQPRAALGCELFISDSGDLLEYRFFLTKIISKFKLNYQEVEDFLQYPEKNKIQNSSKSVENQLFELQKLTDARIKWRKKNAIFNENSTKYYFELNSNAQVVDIKPELKLSSQQLVEEAMLLVNSAASEFFHKNNLEAIFISHSGFAEEKLVSLEKFLQGYKIETGDLDLKTLEGYKELQNRIDENSDKNYLKSYIRRFSSYAAFVKNPQAHLGLGFKSYTSWSSPIRKYSDLINHRVMKEFLLSASQYSIDADIYDRLQNIRKNIRLVEREINDHLYYKFLKNSEAIFAAELVFVTKGGVRVNLVENGANIFVPISMIDASSSNISCDINLAKVYKENQILYKLGDKLKVKLVKNTKAQSNMLIAKIIGALT